MKPVKLIVFKKPKSITKKEPQATVETVWPQILAWMMDFPDSNNTDLYRRFGSIVNLTHKQFCSAVLARGIDKLRSTMKSKKNTKLTKSASIQLIEDVVKTFQTQRKHKAMVHLSRMDVVIDRATTVIEGESERISEMGNAKASMFIESHLDKVSKLHKLATPIYDIDGQSNEDKAKMNMSILMNFNPMPASSRHQDNQDPIDV